MAIQGLARPQQAFCCSRTASNVNITRNVLVRCLREPIAAGHGKQLLLREADAPALVGRRDLLQVAIVAMFGTSVMQTSTAGPAHAVVDAPAPFIATPSGLKIQDVRAGEGATPQPGDQVSVHWSGYTKGYQGKRIDNTSVRDEPYTFILGSGQTIPAFEEAVSSMKVGGIRRIEVPGDRPALGYSKIRSERFTDELISPDLKIFKYRKGPQPAELGGQRALDFVLDNTTLQDFNRDLLFDIKLLSVYRR